MKDLYGVYSIRLENGDTSILMSLVASNPTEALTKAEATMAGWCATAVSLKASIKEHERQ